MDRGDWVKSFVDALHRLEDEGELDLLMGQFEPDASLRTLTHPEPLHGESQIREFWQNYRQLFLRIHSHFERVITSGEEVALEWRAEGSIRQGGRDLSYRGVTLLRRGNAGITEFASYYDPQPFLAAMGIRERAA
jgi:ketosteroid isomerase-like protein